MQLVDVEWNTRRSQARLRFEDGVVLTLLASTMRDVVPRPGQEYTRGEVDGWEQRDAAARAREAALRLLDHRDRSRGELIRSLRKRGHDRAVAEGIADTLESAGVLNDRAYAEAYVRGRIARRPRAGRALVLELRQRLVAESTAEVAVQRVLAEEELEEADLARQATRGWLSRQAPGEVARAREGDRQVRERLYRRARGWLERRGFTGDLAHRQVSRALDGSP